MLWILSEVFYPEETGTGYYISKIAAHLAASQPVSALCSQPSYSCAGTLAPRTGTHGKVKVHRCSCLLPRQGSIASRLVRMVTISVSMLFAALVRIRRRDKILAVTNPPSVPILAALVSFVVGAPYTLLVHDVYPDILAACGVTSTKAVSFRILRWMNRLVLRHAEYIYCIGRDMRSHLAQLRDRDGNERIIVIPLWADCEEIHPAERNDNRLLEDLRLKDKLVVLYAGNMGYPHDIDTLAAAIERLTFEQSIHFLIIGSGPKRKLFEGLVERGYQNLTLLPPRPRADQNEFLNACDVAIISLVPGMLGLAVPSRTYNLMAAGKPIIAQVSKFSEVAISVREEGIGWVVEPGNVDLVVGTIQTARKDKCRLAEIGARARKVAETKYSPARILGQFDTAFSE